LSAGFKKTTDPIEDSQSAESQASKTQRAEKPNASAESNISFKQNGPLSQAPREPQFAANAAAPAKRRDFLGPICLENTSLRSAWQRKQHIPFAPGRENLPANLDANEKKALASRRNSADQKPRRNRHAR
jgi:hypothetical protein